MFCLANYISFLYFACRCYNNVIYARTTISEKRTGAENFCIRAHDRYDVDATGTINLPDIGVPVQFFDAQRRTDRFDSI